MLLRECRQEIRSLRGVGPVVAGRLAKLGIQNYGQLLRHYPRSYQDRRHLDRLASAAALERANVLVEVRSRSWLGRGQPRVLKVVVSDGSAQAALLCFGRGYLAGSLLPGRRFWVSGRFQLRRGELASSNFELEPCEPEEPEGRPLRSALLGKILPFYPLSEGLSQRLMRRLVLEALQEVGADLEDEVPEHLRQRHGLTQKREAVAGTHFPASLQQLGQARSTLIYEELLHYQLALGRSRRARLARRRERRRPPQTLKATLLKRLPFQLTPDQSAALAEIEADLFGPHPAARLLQGEVGSGKTLVALLAALAVIEAGEQVALLSPTGLLAQQHADTAARLLEPLGVRVALLSGSVRAPARELLSRSLSAGEIDLLAGTHALYSAGLSYRRLGLVIVDEQHRFGVRQRQALLSKGECPDLLLMSATPIPRTLALAAFGDLELSELRALPHGRKPVITHLARQGNEGKVYDRVRRELERGGQAYFVYPLIEESGLSDLKDAQRMFATLQGEVFPERRVALLHSRVPEEQKLRVMSEFRAGRIDVLVATSVMEVGVDVPNATCLVVEQAERFGLSALHQLRGRVGRGAAQGYAFLVYGRSLTAGAVERLKAIMGSSDGFQIAEEDLKIRGPGEFLGLRQSGSLRLGVAEVMRDWELFMKARQDAVQLLERDPELGEPAHRVLRRALGATAGPEAHERGTE
jgi:ATP-dependent DNA helicase RecG